ncbi:MAG: hypothetical protein VX526_00960, partial [Actinomycetota bacterium]|nr:hypothetical protein [Actinomycetota bacterium]
QNVAPNSEHFLNVRSVVRNFTPNMLTSNAAAAGGAILVATNSLLMGFSQLVAVDTAHNLPADHR